MKRNNPIQNRKSSKAAAALSVDLAGRGMALIVGFMTCAAFLPVLWNGFVDWDDDKTLTQNPHYRGLSASRGRAMRSVASMP